jgi:hypothetical protein
MFMNMIFYLKNIIDTHTVLSLQAILQAIHHIASSAKDMLVTLSYNLIFKNVIVQLYYRQDLERNLQELLNAWSFHTDSQSFYDLLGLVIFDDECDFKLEIFKVLKKRLFGEFSNLNTNITWTLGTSNLVRDLIKQPSLGLSSFPYKLLSDLLKLSYRHLSLKSNDIILICRYLLDGIISGTVLNTNTISIYRYSLIMLIAIVLQKRPEIFIILYSLLLKLKVRYIQEITLTINSHEVTCARLYLFLFCVKTIAYAYEIEPLQDFIRTTVDRYLKDIDSRYSKYSSILLDDQAFTYFFNFDVQVFKTGDLEFLSESKIVIGLNSLDFEKFIDYFGELKPLDLTEETSPGDGSDWDSLSFTISRQSSYSSIISAGLERKLSEIIESKPETNLGEYPRTIEALEDQDRSTLESILH